MKRLLVALVWLLGLAAILAWCPGDTSTATVGAAGPPAVVVAGAPGATATPPPSIAGGSTTAGADAVSGAVVAPAAVAGSTGGGTPTRGDGATAIAPGAPPAPPAASADADRTAAAPGALPAPAAEARPPSPAASGDAAAAAQRIAATLQGRVIEFAFGRAILTPSGHTNVAEIAAILRDYPSLRIEVRGHTDAIGTADLNHVLSHARADAVKSVLVSRGIDADRVTPSGWGSTQPVADNGTVEGRARNRRIDFHVEEGK